MFGIKGSRELKQFMKYFLPLQQLCFSACLLLSWSTLSSGPGTVSSALSRSVRHRRALDVLEMREIQAPVFYSDDKALRASVAARPKKVTVFQPVVQLRNVAYWRTQKSNQGVIQKGGRWYCSSDFGLLGWSLLPRP